MNISDASQSVNKSGESKKKEEGSIALLGLIVMVVLLTVAIGSLAYIQANYQTTSAIGQQSSALGIAEAGVEHVLWRLNKTDDGSGHYGDTWSVPSDEQDIAFGNGTYYMAALDRLNGHVADIRMQGWIPSRTAPNAQMAEVYATLSYSNSTSYFPMALLTVTSMTLSGSSTTSYNSGSGSSALLNRGDIGTINTANGSITLSGNPDINGTIYYPSGFRGAVTTPGTWWTQYNAISPFSPSPPTISAVSFPSTAIDVNAALDGPVAYKDLYNNAYSGPNGVNYIVFQKTDGTYIGNSRTSLPYIPTSACLYSDGLPFIPAGTYRVHATSGNSMSATNNRVFRFGSGQTTLYLDGNLTIANSAMLFAVDKKPSSLTIFGGTSCGSVSLSGSSPIYGGLYAPYASVSISGSGVFYGAIVCNTATLGGAAEIIYDEALKSTGGSGKYSEISWMQTR